MPHKLIIFGAFAGIAASLPILYEQRPEAFQSALKTALEERPAETPQRPLVVVQEAKVEPARASSQPGRQVRIEAGDRGHFQADFRLNGRSAHAMVDTGATLVAINRTFARQIGIDLSPSDFRYEVKTANGSTAAASAMISRLQIGRIEVRDVQAVVLEDRSLDGVLVGMSFLSRLGAFRVENGTLIMEQ